MKAVSDSISQPANAFEAIRGWLAQNHVVDAIGLLILILLFIAYPWFVWILLLFALVGSFVPNRLSNWLADQFLGVLILIWPKCKS